MNLEELGDRIAINTILDQFVVGQDRMFGQFPIRLNPAAMESLLALFTPNGILHTPFGRSEGRDAIRKNWERIASMETPDGGPKYVRHHLTSREIVLLDPETAHATVYVQGLTDLGVDHWGLYEDRLVKNADGWRFAERLVIVDDCMPGGWYAGMPDPINPVRHWE